MGATQSDRPEYLDYSYDMFLSSIDGEQLSLIHI